MLLCDVRQFFPSIDHRILQYEMVYFPDDDIIDVFAIGLLSGDANFPLQPANTTGFNLAPTSLNLDRSIFLPVVTSGP